MNIGKNRMSSQIVTEFVKTDLIGTNTEIHAQTHY